MDTTTPASPSSPSLDAAALDRLFLGARTFTAWQPRPVDDATLQRLFELARWPPTAGNSNPTRFVFVKSAAAKERLRPALAPMNVEKTLSAPVTAIVAVDDRFHEKMGQLFPARPEMGAHMNAMPAEAREFMLQQNGGLQAGYLMLAARALGLDCGPMAGFDRGSVDRAFLEGTGWRSILLINLGFGDAERLHPRNPRLAFAEACRVE